MTPFRAEIVHFGLNFVDSILKQLFKSVEIFQKFNREGGQNGVWPKFLKILLS